MFALDQLSRSARPGRDKRWPTRAQGGASDKDQNVAVRSQWG
jgi:hypothetical protein